MNFKEFMGAEFPKINIKEEDIRRIAKLSREAFLKQESSEALSFHSFLLHQFFMIRKHWWGIQFLILCMAWHILDTETEAVFIRRDIGILSVLFIIAIVPELWKNLSNRCLEIEMASYYSLHHIYAARMLLLGFVDVTGVSIFAGGVYIILGVEVTDIIFQMLIPMTVTAGICFATMGKREFGMGLPIASCLLMCLFWWWLCGEEGVYTAVSPIVWAGILVLSCWFLLYMALRLLKQSDEYPEVGTNGTCVK